MRCTVALVCLLAGCPSAPLPPVPIDRAQAGGPEDCAPACATLARLGCPGHDGSPGPDDTMGTPDDVSCTDACLDIVAADPVATLYQRCVAKAGSCAAAEACLAGGE